MDPLNPRTGSTASTPSATPSAQTGSEELPHRSGLGRQISASEASHRQTDSLLDDPLQSVPTNSRITGKKVDEVASKGGLFSGLYNAVISRIWGPVKQSDPEEKFLPEVTASPTAAEAPGIGERATGVWAQCSNFVRGGINQLFRATGAVLGTVKNKTYDLARVLTKSYAGVDFQMSDEDWHQLLQELIFRTVGYTNGMPEYQDIHIPKITIKQKNGSPITVHNIKLNARPSPAHEASATVNNQGFINSIDIRQMTCEVEITPPGKPTMQLHLAMVNGKATFGTDLLEILKHPVINGNGLWNTAVVGGKDSVLPMDHTAVHVCAEQLTIGYNHVGARVSFPEGAPANRDEDPIAHVTGHHNSRTAMIDGQLPPPEAIPPETQTACMAGFHKGKVTLKNVSVGRPINILRSASDQSTIFHCSGLKFQNSADLPALVDIDSVELKELDDKHDGKLSCELTVNPVLVRNIKPLNLIPKSVLHGSVKISVQAPIEHGELSVAQLKEGVVVQTKNSLFNRVINSMLKSPGTRLICSKEGNVELQLSIPVLSLIPGLSRITRFWLGPQLKCSVPLPLKGLVASDGAGKVVLSDLVGGVGDDLNNMKILPGRYHFSPPELEASAVDCSRNTLRECQQMLDEAKVLEAKAQDTNVENQKKIRDLLSRAKKRETSAKAYSDPNHRERRDFLATAVRMKARANTLREENHQQCQELQDRAQEKRSRAAVNKKNYLLECRKLLVRAEELKELSHYYEATRAYKAIHVDAYVQLIRESSTDDLAQMHHIAHTLTSHDHAKASRIYIEILKKQSPEIVPEAKNPRWLVNLAQQISTDTEEGKNTRFDILEFACKTDPHAGALQMLAVDTPTLYPAERLSKLMNQLITDSDHFSDPMILASTVTALESRLGKEIEPLLKNYPMTPLLQLTSDGETEAESLLDGLRECMLKHKLTCLAAKTYLDLDDPVSAKVVLEQGIEKDDCNALVKLVKLELQASSAHHSEVVKTGQRLLTILTSDKSSTEMKDTASEMLMEVWELGRSMNIGRQLLQLRGTGPVVSPYKRAVLRLFNISQIEFDDREKMIEIIDSLQSELIKAKDSKDTLPFEKKCIPILVQLLEEINEDISFVEALDNLETEPEPELPVTPPVTTNIPRVEPDILPPEETAVEQLQKNIDAPEDEDDDDELFKDALSVPYNAMQQSSTETSIATSTISSTTKITPVPGLVKDTPEETVVSISSTLSGALSHKKMPNFSLVSVNFENSGDLIDSSHSYDYEHKTLPMTTGREGLRRRFVSSRNSRRR